MTPSVMQYPLYMAVPFQHHTHKPQLVQGAAFLCLFGFLPDGTSSRDLPVPWGPKPTAHTWASRAEMSAVIAKRSLKGTSVPCALLPLGSGGQEPPAAPSSPCLAHLASSWRSWCCTEGRARHPCPATSPLLQPSHTAAAFKLMLL